MPVETSAPVAGQTKISVPMISLRDTPRPTMKPQSSTPLKTVVMQRDITFVRRNMPARVVTAERWVLYLDQAGSVTPFCHA